MVEYTKLTMFSHKVQHFPCCNSKSDVENVHTQLGGNGFDDDKLAAMLLAMAHVERESIFSHGDTMNFTSW